MKCLFCTSEALPFVATGGLGDVSGALPKILCKKGIDCRVILPLYECIDRNFYNIKFIKSFTVPVAWRNQYCGLFECLYNDTKYYFIDNEYYFKRNGIYGHYDDAERFAFFSRACIETLKHLDFKVDIIHCNDWQTALIPIYKSKIYYEDNFYSDIKTIFTIHNIQYQGKYSMDIINDVFGISNNDKNILEFDGCINLMKGAIETSNKITTVSTTYAEEICYPYYSHGLDSIVRNNKWKLYGIVNGIDIDLYNPKIDKFIYSNYSYENLEKKLENKLKLQEHLNLKVNQSIPIIAMVTRLAEHKGMDIVKYAFEKMINEKDFQFIILGSGDSEYESFFYNMQCKYPFKVSCCRGFVTELSHKIYAASDIFLMPSKSEPCGLSQMIALRYGSIPIVRNTGGLKDTVRDSGDGFGVGFVFNNYDANDMVNAIYRAIEGYKNKEGWNLLMKRAMKEDNSWNKSASKYINLYNSILNPKF